jgi:XRE family transcriptional regulator, aerobic/anaerobic benzoate catabolism transcriptional regulator
MQYIADMQDATASEDGRPGASSSEVARRIRSARDRVGITRKQLATASGASERYLALLEAGAGNPTIDKMLAIADALGLAMAELLPMGGERDEAVTRAASLLRRLPPEELQNLLAGYEQRPDVMGLKQRRIALIGLRGAGKSSLGQALAERLVVPFFEVSKEVERRYGGSIGVLLEINGPAALRRYETDVLGDICQANPAAIIAAPGAIVSDAKLFEQLLHSAWTVWLQARPEDHMERVVAQGDLRPMTGNRAAMNDLKSILSAREADYRRADMTVDTSAQGFDATLEVLAGIATKFVK